jgi:glutamate-ammonia-ligase adenylyltransferase
MMSGPKNPALAWTAYSPYAQRWLHRYPEWAAPLHAEKPLPDAVQHFLWAQHWPDEEAALRQVLRLTRQRLLLEIMRRDLQAEASLAEVTQSMSLLADFTVDVAARWAQATLALRYGAPAENDSLMVVGMGKLGGRELNVSSDIDLVFLYGSGSETLGGPSGKKLSHAEFFTQAGRKIIGLLSDPTEDGFVFRVDMRLRPNGTAGPLACSLDMLEEYFMVQGREWERYAWIKGRVVNGAAFPAGRDVFHQNRLNLLSVARPFVYRKYLDFGVIRALRALHRQIRQEVAQREAHLDRYAIDVKLGRGGIREIEFVAQVFQLIRGGRDATLRVRPTLKVLQLCAEKGLLDGEDSARLCQAYDFWRRLEHRLQYIDDAQTHRLPAELDSRLAVAHSMGFANLAEFDQQIDEWRSFVSDRFDAVFGDKHASDDEDTQGCWPAQCNDAFADLATAQARWAEFLESSRYKSLPAAHQERLDRLLPHLVREAAHTEYPDRCWLRCCGFLEAIARRGTYLSLLDEFPHARRRVLRMLASSEWATFFLKKYPILLDELLDEAALFAEPDWQAYENECRHRLNQVFLPGQADADIERRLDLIRELHHAQLFRLLAQDLEGHWTVEQLSDHLSALADRTLAVVLQQCWDLLPHRHRPQPQFAVIAYGKLGGKELGYASDLDLIFIYDDDDERASEIYTLLAKRFNRWLTLPTAAGILFDTDYRLRPNGIAGLMVTSFDGFSTYQRRVGGSGAWLWEHQALSRARFCVGNPAVGERFEVERRTILQMPRDWQELRDDVVAMRQRMHEGHVNTTTLFDLKHDPGGMVDVEFVVQALVLGHAHRFATLTENKGNIALLQRCSEYGLIDPVLAHACAQAYRRFRAAQHALRLEGVEHSRTESARFADEQLAVKRLWAAVLG